VPVFPLGLVLFPRAILPLHVFEPRYLEMMSDIGDRGEFGVTLIERGSEVGGGDQRFNVGTLAQVLHSVELDGGRLAVVAIGTRRFRVAEWLPDDPYPRAIVETMANQAASPDTAELIDRALALRRRIYGLASEAGVDVGDPTIEVSDDPVAASWQLCAVSPVATLDQQQLVEMDDPTDRLRHLITTMGLEAQTLEAQLATG
jgi:Lon protease-like protein